MILPSHNDQKLTDWSSEIIDRCRASVGARTSVARTVKQWTYTGSPDGNTAILNRLFPHLDRKAGYLFSPQNLRFHIEFSHTYPKEILDRAEVASRVLTKEFEMRDIDMQFAEGVFLGLQYGACFPKITVEHGGLTCYLVMPWQLGVYREDKNDFHNQEAICETTYITPFDLWRRISHLPNAIELFRRARAYAKRRQSTDEADSYFHQVLIAGTPPTVQTDPPFTQQPGGFVQVTSNPAGAIMAPEVAEELITIHELWVRDDDREGDFTTIQIAEPDILIAPRFRRQNMFVPDYLPYGIIQPNRLQGYFFGRTELSDLFKLQNLLRDRLEDIKKIMGMQYDRLLAFLGNSGMTDEAYDQFRQTGYIALEPGSDVKDLTPPVPKEAFADITEILKMMDEVSGFQNILSGQGEPGVRAGVHAQTLLRTASPRLRDQALAVERQCADLADKVFQALAAKKATAYWARDGEEFLLSQIPDDYHITVDSHSSSPIYEEDHMQVAAFLAKSGFIDGESTIEMMPVPRKDLLKQRYVQMQQQKAEQLHELEQHPELLKVIKGGKR